MDEQNQRFSGITFPDGNQVLFQQISRPVPHTIGKHPAILRNERSLGVIRFKEGGNIEFSYGINDDRLPTFTFGETQIVWDPERSTILSKDGWKYQIGIPKPAGNNIPMSRTDSDGHRESYLFLNLQETESM